MKKVRINEIEYEIKPFDYNKLVDLEDKGVSLFDINNKPLSFYRGIIGECCFDGDLAKAGEEINNHIIKTGDATVISKVCEEIIEDSGFLKALIQGQIAQ